MDTLKLNKRLIICKNLKLLCSRPNTTFTLNLNSQPSMETEYVPVHLESLAAFLIRHHSDQLRSITLSPDPKLHYPLYIDYAELMDEDPPLAHLIFSKPTHYLRFFDDAAVWAHKIIFDKLKVSEKGVEKKFIHVRISIGWFSA
ncbi:hypothetical protein Patl1_37175 [Pistacia atlantica]|nr:hypothetical protein Patl1_37175 [Pistacia atlantica]